MEGGGPLKKTSTVTITYGPMYQCPGDVSICHTSSSDFGEEVKILNLSREESIRFTDGKVKGAARASIRALAYKLLEIANSPEVLLS